MFKVRNKQTGEKFDCFAQMVELNFDGKWYLRYNIGLQQYNDGWAFIHAIYDNDKFNETYEVIQ